jgi:homoserine/homoserine lactone efflux protein
MIPTELLFTFGAAAFAVILIPGPTVLLVTGYALSAGLRTALLSIVGVCLGDAVAMTLTFLGLGAVLAASAEWFVVLKWLGSAYLIYLGVQLWRAPVVHDAPDAPQYDSPFGTMARAFAVNVLHPKGLAFYAAFLPQFVDPAYPPAPQMLVLGATFVAIALCVLLSYALAAAQFRAVLVRSRVRRAFNRSGAACLVVAGVYMASLNHGG